MAEKKEIPKRLRYPVREAAQLLGVSESTIYRLVWEEELTASCDNGVGKKPVFITHDSLIDYHNKKIVPKEKWNE